VTARAPRRSEPRARPPVAVAGAVASPALPPALRDPWLLVSALAVLPIVLHGLGAPLGEPVAEDFDFLRHNVLLGRHGLFDGGGSQAFWRPVSHQLYYALLGPLILAHPRIVATLHALLLAVAAALLYRALRRWWSGPQAAVAAAFPFLMESVRTVFAWPSHGVELTSLLFTVLAFHAASRRRLATCLVALALALLSKEVAVVAALLLPFLPSRPGEVVTSRERARWAIAIGATTAAWAIVYLWVRQRAGLVLPHQLESNPATLAVPLGSRLVWATWNSLRAVISLPAASAPSRLARAGALATVVVFAIGLGAISLGAGARARARAAWPWIAWGTLWFLLSTATLTTIFPFWMPNRALFGSVGLGIAVAALLGAAWPALPWVLAVVRLVTFAASPGPSATIAIDASETGAFMDFQQLTRLQRLMTDTRAALAARFPTLPHGALVGQHSMPRRADYAFGGDHALQCWYRDTTVRWVRFEDYARDSTIPLTTIIEYQLGSLPSVALVAPGAMRDLLAGAARLHAGDLAGAESRLRAALAEQRDPAARVFLGTALGMAAGCRMGVGDSVRAIAESRQALAIYRENGDARFALASMLERRGAHAEAAAELDTLLAISPGDADARALRERIAAEGF